MLKQLVQFDIYLFKILNQAHSPFWDGFMFWVSDKLIWIPLYVFILTYLYLTYKRKSIPIILGVGLLIFMTDGCSNYFFKDVFHRLRPCHALAGVHTVYDKCGGKYGFVSSHAANVFGLATYLSLFLRKDIFWFFIPAFLWAGLIAYSRIYLGVHYPADITVGALLGIMLGWINYKFVQTNILPRF